MILAASLLADPDDHVVGLHISSKMSGTLQSAMLAAQGFDPGRIHLVDTESVKVRSKPTPERMLAMPRKRLIPT